MVLTVTVQFRRLPCLPEESFMLKWFFVLEVRVLYSALFNCQSLLITDFLELSSTTVTSSLLIFWSSALQQLLHRHTDCQHTLNR